MALTSLRQLLDHAAEHGYGMPAFNITNLETLQGVMQAADAAGSPVILQASQSAMKYVDPILLKHLFAGAIERYPAIPICVHLDHGSSLAVCTGAMQLGFSSVMMDGSLEEDLKTPSTYDYNVGVTRATVRAAHADTGVDALAVAVGTSHGAYKFSRRPTGDILAMEVIEAIHRKLPQTHLVMHGASTIPTDLQELINAHGGSIATTFGVPLDEVERGIRSGVRKVNIDTDIRMALTGSMRKYLMENPSSFDIRALNKPGVARVKALCIERFERFGAAGQASRIKAIPLEQMRKRYAAGTLAGPSEFVSLAVNAR